MLLNPPYGERIEAAGVAGLQAVRVKLQKATMAASSSRNWPRIGKRITTAGLLGC